MANNFTNPNPQYLDANGDPLSGGKIDFFEAGGTSTRKDTFTDKDLTGGNENVNPIILDAAGRSPTAMFMKADITDLYNVRILTSADVVVWARDFYSIAVYGSGTGDFSGPVSSTDNALVRFNGTEGKTGQNSGWLLGDDDTMNAQDKILQRPELKDVAYVANELSGTGAKTIDLESGNYVSHTAFGAITWTISNTPASRKLGIIYLKLITGGIGTQTWPSNLKWPGGSAPTLQDNTATVTATAATDRISDTSHGFKNGDLVHFTTTGTLPAGLSLNTTYSVRSGTANDYQLDDGVGGGTIDITDTGSGTHTRHSGEDWITIHSWKGASGPWTGYLVIADAQ